MHLILYIYILVASIYTELTRVYFVVEVSNDVARALIYDTDINFQAQMKTYRGCLL